MKKSDVIYLILRILFIMASIGVICWIFSNSIADGETSTQQSSEVKEVVDTTLTVVSGKPVDIPMLIIRKLAHFTEYFILGVCMYLAFYFFRTRNIFILIPCAVGVIIPVIDENIQLSSDGRHFAVIDMLIDMGGVACGIGITLAACLLVMHIYHRHILKKSKISADSDIEVEAAADVYTNKENDKNE